MCEHMPPSDRGDELEEPLRAPSAQRLNDKLASLALLSEEAGEVAEGLERADRQLAQRATASSDFADVVRVLRRKVEQLRGLSTELSTTVMRYSLLLEDEAPLAAPRASRRGARRNAEDDAARQ